MRQKPRDQKKEKKKEVYICEKLKYTKRCKKDEKKRKKVKR